MQIIEWRESVKLTTDNEISISGLLIRLNKPYFGPFKFKPNLKPTIFFFFFMKKLKTESQTNVYTTLPSLYERRSLLSDENIQILTTLDVLTVPVS